jgi:probable F420-dependent oxidoreductase
MTMSRPVNVGFMLPQYGDLASRETLRYFGALAEELGYESVWSADHIIMPTEIKSPYPYTEARKYPADPYADNLEPFVLLGYLAGVTETVKLGFTVLILPYRHPLETAKMIACLDVLSGGRVLLGVGVGWLAEEHEALGVAYRDRGKRADEILDIWKQLWAGGDVQFDGRYYQVHDVVCRPLPLQKPYPPITVGGHSKAAYARMLRHNAQGFQIVLNTAEDSYGLDSSLAKNIELMKRMAEQHGRDPETIEITGVFLTTTADRFLSEVDAYRRLGLSRFILDFPSFSPSVSAMEETLRTVANELGVLRSAS